MDNLGDLNALLTPLLNDPEAMSNLRQAAEQMGLGGLLPENDRLTRDGDITHGGNSQNISNAEKGTDPLRSMGLSPDMLSAVGRLAPLLSEHREDDTTRLLTALRPFLSQPRVKRLDEAERLLSVGRVLSILKESKLM